VPFPASFAGGKVDNNAAAGVGGLADELGGDVGRKPQALACDTKAVGVARKNEI
jgi:hypothetical protein